MASNPISPMSKKQLILTSLFLALAAVLGALTFLEPAADSGDGAVEPGGAAAVEALTPGGEAEGLEGPGTARLVDPQAESSDALERTSADRDLTYAPAVAGGEGRWLTGRVLFPERGGGGEGGEGDDTLEVFALESETSYPAFLRRVDPTFADDESSPASTLLGRAPVEADGTFRLAVASSGATYLMLRGRYLFTPEAMRVPADHGDTGDPIELTAVAGACLVLHPRAPEGRQTGSGRLILRTSRDDEVPNPLLALAGGNTRLGLAAPLTADPIEVRALPAGVTYDVIVLPEELAALVTTTALLEPFETQGVDLALTAGATVTGSVVDTSGTPIADAEVHASFPGTMFGFDDRRIRTGRSGQDGHFTLEAVSAGTVALNATHATRLESKKVTKRLSEGAEVGGVTLTLEDGQTVTGRVVHEDGAPAAGIEVRARFDQAFLAGPSAFNALRGAEGQATTDSEGRFVLKGLGGGPFVLQAELEPAEDSGAPPLRARRDNVPPGSQGIDLILHPPMGLWGRVVDTEGVGLAAFRVKATRQAESAVGSMGVDVRELALDPSEDGAFFLEDMIEGNWHVSAIAPGYRSLEPTEVSLPSETEENPVLVRVSPTATVAGIVLDPDGRPIEGATVEVDSAQPNWVAMMSQGLESPTATSREEGRFLLESAPPGSLALYAHAEGFARGEAVQLELAPREAAEDVVLHLALGGRLTGDVYDNEGNLAPNMMIIANSMTMDQAMASTDAEGRFEFIGLPAGSYQVIAMDRSADMSGAGDGDMGNMMSSMKISQAKIVDGEDTHIVIGAPPANPVRVYGRVTHGDAPFDRSMVSFFPSGTKLYEKMKFANVDKRGEYEILVDGPGEYVVFVQRIGGAPGQQQNIEFSREVPEVDEFRLNFELPLGRISGTVFGPDRAPRPGTRITLSPAGGVRSDSLMGGQYAEIQAGSDGTYDLPALRPGRYTLSAGGAPLINAGGGASLGRVTREVEVREDEWLENVDFTLAEPGAIDALVTDATGAPVQGAYIFVRNGDGRIIEPFSLATTDGAGHFKQWGLAPGDYTVTARRGPLVSPESAAVRVSAGGTAKLELTMDEGAILWVRIRDKEGPVRANLRIVDADGREWSGMFGMEDLQHLYMDGAFSPTEHRVGPLPPGKYRVHAEAGGRSDVKPVTLKGSEERKLTIRLK